MRVLTTQVLGAGLSCLAVLNEAKNIDNTIAECSTSHGKKAVVCQDTEYKCLNNEFAVSAVEHDCSRYRICQFGSASNIRARKDRRSLNHRAAVAQFSIMFV